MQALHSVPLLSRLPRVELAKLVSDIQAVEVRKGEDIPPADGTSAFVYFVYEGKVSVYLELEQLPITLMVLGTGEVFGESGQEWATTENRLLYRAAEDAVLYRMESARFQEILSQHPTLLRQFSEAMIKRSHSVLDELARTKSALLVHATEVWSLLEETAEMAQVQDNAAAAVAFPEPEPPPPAKRLWRPILNYVGPIAAAGTVFALGGFSVSPPTVFMSILVWAVLSWLTDALPDYVVALTVILASGIVGVVSSSVAFSGFSHMTWFLLLAVLGISAGISKTGLLYRVALYMLRLFPPTYSGQSAALAIGGFALAPFLPGVTGRQAMASRLSLELGEAMGFKPHSRGASGLAMACYLGFSCLYYISMTGGSVTLMVWSILPEAVKQNLSWSSWLFAALPASLLVFGATLMVILRLYQPEDQVRISRDIVQSQLRILGPMNRQEWITVWVVLAIVGAFITQPLHGIDPTWVALPGFLLLSASGIVDRESLKRSIDWGFLLLTGGLLGVASITSQSGFVTMFSDAIVPLVRPLAGSPWLFLTAVAVVTTIIHLAVPFQPTILLTALAFAPVAADLGYNPFVVGLVILIMASHFVVPQGNPMYLAAYGGTERKAFTHEATRRLALLHALITLVAVWVSIPIWQLVGLL